MADWIRVYTRSNRCRVETFFEIGVRVGASGKAKRTSEAFVVNQSIVDRASETGTGTETEDIVRWEGG
jgi:hypothetical protein